MFPPWSIFFGWTSLNIAENWPLKKGDIFVPVEEDGRGLELGASLEEGMLTFGPNMAFPGQPRTKKQEKTIMDGSQVFSHCSFPT